MWPLCLGHWQRSTNLQIYQNLDANVTIWTSENGFFTFGGRLEVWKKACDKTSATIQLIIWHSFWSIHHKNNIHDNGAFWEERSSNIFFCLKAVIPQFDNPPPRDLYNSSYHTTGEDNILYSTNRHLSLTFAFNSSGIRSCLSLQPLSNSCFLALLRQNRCCLLDDVICPIFLPSLGKRC